MTSLITDTREYNTSTSGEIHTMLWYLYVMMTYTECACLDCFQTNSFVTNRETYSVELCDALLDEFQSTSEKI